MCMCRCIKCVLAYCMFVLKHICVQACVFVHVPACVFTPAALKRYRECQEAVEAAGAWGAWLSVDGDETGQLYSSGARCSIRHRLDLNIALEQWSCLSVPPKALWSSSSDLNPHSGGKAPQSLSLSWPDNSGPALFLSVFYKEFPNGWVWATVCWRVSVCLRKCDDMLWRCYCEERETELPFRSACLSSGWPQSCILDQTQNHKAQQCV